MSEPPSNTVIQCLAAIGQHHGVIVNPERLIHDYAQADEEPKTAKLLQMATDIGLKAKSVKLNWKGLLAQGGVFPLIARLKDGAGVIVVGARAGDDGVAKIAILDPAADIGAVALLGADEFNRLWGGEVILLKRTFSFLDTHQPFSFRWFIPEILKQRTAFRDIALAAVALQMLGLATPLFFQNVIDKVLPHQSSSTLWVLAVGVGIALVFDSVFGYVRQFLLLAATNKVDMQITRRAFGHLLSLPIDYFESTTAGVITQHMRQLEGIRNFLTGRVFFTALDAAALLIFIPLLFVYSFQLTLIVLAFSIVISGIILAILPTYRRRLEALYAAEGKRQSILVETIHGMRTVKALAIEPIQRRNWDQLSAEAITTHFRVGQVSIAGGALTDFLGKLMPVTIIVIGAQGVFDQSMSVGALIAFQMLSGRVTGPLLQIVGLINDYQQTALGVRMLGEIMNRPPEGRIGAGGLRPQLKGELSFEDVTFKYPGASINALDRANFHLPAGVVVGIVGRSGSGKTTIAKMIQGLYPPHEGIIRFDGVDAREIDLPHLRRQVGVVMQENFLFRGTVRENIAMTKPDATFEEIVAASRASGAEEFIERLPMGYDTLLEENASNLSGGQKQRLSIARSLLVKPRILILDEAASALDPESESIFIQNLGKIAVGRTVIMISHRLSTLVNAHAILVMQQGKLADIGKHDELLKRCEVYRQLWNQQSSHL